MRYIKTFESFSINEEEEIFKSIAGFFGKYNEDTRQKAEKAMEEWGKKYPDSSSFKVFNILKEAYDAKSGTKLPASNTSTFKYPETELSTEEVKTLFENACSIIRMNEAKAFGLKVGKEGKLEAYQTTSYSAAGHQFGGGGEKA